MIGVLKVASWVASAMLRRVELWDDNLVIPPALAARAAVLAFGDELVDLELPVTNYLVVNTKQSKDIATSFGRLNNVTNYLVFLVF